MLSVLFFFFLIDYLGHGLLGWGGSWLLDWPDDGLGGVHDILGGGPSKKLSGAQALFFLFSENFTC